MTRRSRAGGAPDAKPSRLAVIAIAITLVASCSSAATPAPATAPQPRPPRRAAPDGRPATAAPATAAPATAAPASAPPAGHARGSISGRRVSRGSPTHGRRRRRQFTMWSRAATQARAGRWCKPITQSHKNHIDVTYVPTDDYQTKVGAAAGGQLVAGSVLGRRRVHAQLDLGGAVPGHHRPDHRLPSLTTSRRARSTSSTWDGKKYGLPFVVDLRSGCTTRNYSSRRASTRRNRQNRWPSSRRTPARSPKLGGDVHGTFFGGDCGGCKCSPGGRSPGPTARRS